MRMLYQKLYKALVRPFCSVGGLRTQANHTCALDFSSTGDKLGLVVFKKTEFKIPTDHVTGTKCRPDITAAFQTAFDVKGQTSWPSIRMVGEWASTGTTKEKQKRKAFSYLHFLLLARPDLYIAPAIFASETEIIFIVGIGGFGIRCLKKTWTDGDLPTLLYAFIYRIYKPGFFADPTCISTPITNDGPLTWTLFIKVKSGDHSTKENAADDAIGGEAKTDLGEVEVVGVGAAEGSAKDAITENEVKCGNFRHIYGCNPFGTRTHVFTTTQPVKIDDRHEDFTVIKDQLCKTGTRFLEHEILRKIHVPQSVPGVVEGVCHEIIQPPPEVAALNIGRDKHRHGLRQTGAPFEAIPTVREMLQTAYDTIEGKSLSWSM
jgi:hypothetical protein